MGISKKSTRCQVHGVGLQRTQVRVIYGRPANATSFATLIMALQDLFPYAKSHVLWVARLGANGSSIELVCPECRATEREWEKANNRKAEPEIVRADFLRPDCKE